MSDDDLKAFEAAVNAENDYMEEVQLRAKRYWQERRFPADPAAWLAKAEAEFTGNIPRLPPDLREKFNTYAREQLRHARRCLAVDDHDGLAVALMLLDENVDAVRKNINLKTAYDYSDGQSQKASQSRTPAAIDDVLSIVARRKGKPGDLWNEFIGDLALARIEVKETSTDSGELQIHYTDDYTGANRTMTIGRFRSRLRELRKNKK